jgi:hypothetical protein
MVLSDADRTRKDKELSRKILALDRTKAQLLKQLVEVDSSLRLMHAAQQSLRRKSKTDKLIDLVSYLYAIHRALLTRGIHRLLTSTPFPMTMTLCQWTVLQHLNRILWTWCLI